MCGTVAVETVVVAVETVVVAVVVVVVVVWWLRLSWTQPSAWCKSVAHGYTNPMLTIMVTSHLAHR